MWLQRRRIAREAHRLRFRRRQFSHIGARVTFEVMLASFGLEQTHALQRIGAIVHYLDVGGVPAPEAVGLESVLAGLRDCDRRRRSIRRSRRSRCSMRSTSSEGRR